MNFKLSGNKIINGDVESPEMVYAVFNDDLRRLEMKRIISTLNHGHDMLSIYRQHRDNMHINNVVEMIKKMEDIFRKFEYEIFLASREKE